MDAWSPLDLAVALEAVYSASLDGVMITGPDERIVMVNDTYAEMTGYTAAELIGRRPNVVASGATPRQTYRDMWRDLSTDGRWTGEVANRRKNGQVWFSFLSITKIEREGRLLGYIGIARDVTKQKQTLLTFRRLALLDELTGVFNRRYFERQLPREVASARREALPLSLLMIDIDDFKPLNDHFGHEAGDRVLCRVAGGIAANVRVEDITCRYGGEEFVVIMPRTGRREAAGIAERVRAAVWGGAYELPEPPTPVSVSVGVCTTNARAGETGSMVSTADRALYQAKAAGKNRVHICHDARPPSAGRRRPGNHPAIPCLAADSGTFWRSCEHWGVRTVLQPIVDLSSGAIAGYEALARGRVGSPVETAPALLRAADDRGYRCALSGLTCDAALKNRLLPGQRLFVNVDPTLATCPHVGRCPAYRWLRENDGDDAGMVLEISERTNVRDQDMIEAFVERSRVQGYSFALDDVGTAYAGLQTLLWLKPEYLKIDRSLISGIDLDPPRTALVRSLLDYARLTGTRTVAEGVETEGELRTVIALGVDLGQGFFLCPPASEPGRLTAEALTVIGRADIVE